MTGLSHSTADYRQVRAALFLTEPTPHTEDPYADSGTWWCFATREGLRTDFDADGKADLLWRHGKNGELWFWLTDGATLVNQMYVDAVPDAGYRIGGTGDYDGDGNADILWHHAMRGDDWVWLMNGTVVAAEVWAATVPDIGYRIVNAE